MVTTSKIKYFISECYFKFKFLLALPQLKLVYYLKIGLLIFNSYVGASIKRKMCSILFCILYLQSSHNLAGKTEVNIHNYEVITIKCKIYSYDLHWVCSIFLGVMGKHLIWMENFYCFWIPTSIPVKQSLLLLLFSTDFEFHNYIHLTHKNIILFLIIVVHFFRSQNYLVHWNKKQVFLHGREDVIIITDFFFTFVPWSENLNEIKTWSKK